MLPILEAVDELTRQIENGVEPTRNIYHRLISYKPNEGLLKWQSEKEHHFNSVKRNLEGLKFQIEEETQRILRDFAEQLQKAKAELYLDLEQYYVSYCERFERFAQMTDPIVAMYDRFQLYTNRNALLFKFGTEDEPYKLRNWLTQLKKSIHFTLGSLRSPE